MKQVTVSELKNAINFSKIDYDLKRVKNETENFNWFLQVCVDATNDNYGSLVDAIEIAETSFKSL